MIRSRQLQCVDLFAGAGGFSSGLLQAAAGLGYQVDLLAINHWQVAIATHSKNHPGVRHQCESVEKVNPREAIPGGRLQLLMASPECMHHSRARGGRPVNDQSRATAWHILRWAEALYIDHLLIENVPEFQEWGPLGAGGRPLQRGKGQLFQQFVRTLRTLDYTVDWRVLNAADYGDPTTRKRLFIRAAKGHRKVVWPEPSHRPAGTDSLGLFAGVQPWRPAREIIDWSLMGKSIFHRDRPLSPNTLRRIEAGLRKYSGLPFVISCANTGSRASGVRSTEDPVQTVTGRGHLAVIEPALAPFLIGAGGPEGQQVPRSVDGPLPTLLTRANLGVVEPFLIPYNGERDGQAGRCLSLEEPLGTVTTANRFGLVEGEVQELPPFLTAHYGGATTRDLDQPLPTVTANYEHFGLTQPFLIVMRNNQTAQSLDQPLPTITAGGIHAGVAEPFLVKYYGSSDGGVSVNEPLDTITARDRFGLVEPLLETEDGRLFRLDIRFRMLQPHELAAAMSFPADYEFQGKREEIVKQIGNAVPVGTARALCQAILAG